MKVDSEQFESVQKDEIVTVSHSDTHIVRIYRVNDEDYQFATALYLSENELVFGCHSMDTARLAAGVFDKLDHGLLPLGDDIEHPDTMNVPIPIAAAGQQVLAAWMKMYHTTESNTTQVDNLIEMKGSERAYIADAMGVELDTISSYCNRVRWDGCTECGGEDIEKKTLRIAGDEVEITDCFECGHYFVTPEDLEKRTHTQPLPSCGSEFESTIIESEGDSYRLWLCDSCGFYTAEPDRLTNELTA